MLCECVKKKTSWTHISTLIAARRAPVQCWTSDAVDVCDHALCKGSFGPLGIIVEAQDIILY